MVERENSSKGFLERWSRKKIEGERETPDATAEPSAKKVSLPAQAGFPEPATTDGAKIPVQAVPKPEFDLASLPSLDSITAATDVRAFLAPGVPKELALAALRRAWSADPAIRNFVGLAENAWDFTDPTAMPGFGALPESYDIKKMLAQIFGESEKPADPATASGQQPTPQVTSILDENTSPKGVAPLQQAETEPAAPRISADEKQVVQVEIVRCNNNIATHHSISPDETEERKNRRRHGGALPQ